MGPAVVTVIERWLSYAVTAIDRFHCMCDWLHAKKG